MKTIWNIDPTSFKVDEKKKEVTTSGLPELVGRTGRYEGDDMAMFLVRASETMSFMWPTQRQARCESLPIGTVTFLLGWKTST